MTKNWTPILIVVAHPDDEVIGTAIQLSRWDPSRVSIIHVTDGSPQDFHDAAAAGFQTREDYFHQRRRELYSALDLVNIRPDQCMSFNYPDKETMLHLPELTSRLVAYIEQLRPGAVYTHPYEGGHPDHDATAFAVAHAASCPIHEFTSYYEGPNGLVVGEFLPNGGGEIETLEPTDEELELKRKMYRCFKTQQKVLSDFSAGPERFRPAPQYDFTQAPHAGTLHYEKLGWGITGEQWRQKAAEAVQLLGPKAAL